MRLRTCRPLAMGIFLAAAAVSWPAGAAEPVVSRGSGVEVDARVTPDAATQARVALRLRGVVDARGGTVRYSVTGPARILRQDAAPLPAGREAMREVLLQVDPAQRAYLHVFTTQAGRTGVVSVPLGAAPTSLPPPSKAMGSDRPGGEPLVVLPARMR